MLIKQATDPATHLRAQMVLLRKDRKRSLELPRSWEDLCWLCAARGDNHYAARITISIFQMCVDGHRVVWIVRLRKFVERQFKGSLGVLIRRRLTENKISAAALSGFEIKTQLIGFGYAHQDAVADNKRFGEIDVIVVQNFGKLFN